ncbi:restriction endonuclease subunit S [Acinetobacter baumannii]|nr:restriction endonuclease subunit S [Acinetobacter baumannii]NUF20877.1 restriction endonuclease subunit S [Acinetobacter baumannii]HAV5921276.1 restriction endonuclease subunit S [Acinetobacter baumannii]
MSAPKLRFKEFDTEVEVKRLGDISNIVVGFVGTVSDQYCDKSEGIPFVRTQNVRDGYFSLDNLEYVTQDFHQKNKKSQIFNGDVLIARVGANMGMVCAVENLNTEANCANVIIIKKNSQLSSEYLSLFLNSENGQKQIHSGGAGGAQAVFNTTLAKEIRFPYFPLDEQTKIASFLSAVDEKIAQLTQKHELLSQYKQGMMQKLFSQQIRFKADDGSEFEEWSNKTIGDIANIKRGASPRPITDSKWFDESSNIGWVRISDVSKSKKYLLETEQYLSPEGIQKSRLVPKGNLIMSICATIGKPIYTGFDVCIHDGFVVFSELQAIHEYAYYYLEFIEKNWYQYGQPGTQVNLNSDIVSNEEFPFPCLEEQTKIANFLSSIDQKIDVASEQLEQAKLWKKGLLQQMFV